MSTYDRINLVRKERGITWNALNSKVEGAYHGRMTDLKNGKTSLSNSQLQTVADILGTTLDYLLGNTDDPTPAGQKEQPPAQGGELTEKDISLIRWFRSLPPEKQKAILISQDAPENLVD